MKNTAARVSKRPEPDHAMSGGTFTTSIATDTLTLKDLEAALARLHAADPLRAQMVREGFDPAKGCLMILPERMRPMFLPYGAPEYCRFSKIATEPIMIRGPYVSMERQNYNPRGEHGN